jgi:hypothetical protein
VNTQKFWQMGSLCCTQTIFLNGSSENSDFKFFVCNTHARAKGTKPIYITLGLRGPILCCRCDTLCIVTSHKEPQAAQKLSRMNVAFVPRGVLMFMKTIMLAGVLT